MLDIGLSEKDISIVLDIPLKTAIKFLKILFNGEPEKFKKFIYAPQINFFGDHDGNVHQEKIEILKHPLYDLFKGKYYNKHYISNPNCSKFGLILKKYFNSIVDKNFINFYTTFEKRLMKDAINIKNKLDFDCSRIIDISLHGDPHFGGSQVVSLIDFNGKEIFYKPRSINGFEIISKVFDKVNKIFDVQLSYARYINNSYYGWLESLDFIKININDVINAKTYGAMIAISQYLGLSDLHMENVRWTKKGMIIIDIDVMFRAIETNDIDEIAGFCIPQSTGLVPYHDIIGTKNINLEFNNDGTIKCICSTFRDVLNFLIFDTELYNFIMTFADLLICRYIPRNTETYMQIISKLKGDGLSNNCVFFLRVLSKLLFSIDSKPVLNNLIDSEYKQILNGDIPCFYRKVNDNRSHYFNNAAFLNGIDFFKFKINKYKKGFMDTSTKMLEHSFSVSLKKNMLIGSQNLYTPFSAQFENRTQATFLSFCMLGSDWSIFPMSIDLYSGLSGLLIKELILSKIGLRKDYNLSKKLAENLYIKISRNISKNHIGFLSGQSGAMLSLSLYMYLTGDECYDLSLLLKNINTNIISTKSLDFYDGLAGVICALHLMVKHANAKNMLYLLCETCTLFLGKIKLLSSDDFSKFEPGIAHGLSGLCLALNLTKNYLPLCNNNEVDIMIASFLRKETDQYLSQQDLVFSAWCKGAFGMLQVRKLLQNNYKIKELSTVHEIYNCDMNGWCHGIHSMCILENKNLPGFIFDKWSAPYRLYNLGLYTGMAGMVLSDVFSKISEKKNLHLKALILDLLLPQ